jgi:hypothetical protein
MRKGDNKLGKLIYREKERDKLGQKISPRCWFEQTDLNVKNEG